LPVTKLICVEISVIGFPFIRLMVAGDDQPKGKRCEQALFWMGE